MGITPRAGDWEFQTGFRIITRVLLHRWTVSGTLRAYEKCIVRAFGDSWGDRRGARLGHWREQQDGASRSVGRFAMGPGAKCLSAQGGLDPEPGEDGRRCGEF